MSISNGRKASLRHVWIVFRLSYQCKRYIRRLQDNLTRTKFSKVHLIDVLWRYLRTRSERNLLKMFSRQLFRLSFNLSLFMYFLFSYIWPKRCHNVKLCCRCSKKVTLLQHFCDVGFATTYQRSSISIVFLKSFSCIRTEKRDFWSCLVQLSGIAPCFLVANSTGLWLNLFLCSRKQKMRV